MRHTLNPPLFLIGATLLGSITVPDDVAAEEPLAGAVVTIDMHSESAPALLEAARRSGGADWVSHNLAAESVAGEPVPEGALDALKRHYLDADFFGCLSALHASELSQRTLLERELAGAAATAAVLGAACALGAGDADLARRLLQPALVAELDLHEALAITTPELQALAEDLRATVTQPARVTLTIVSQPPEATITVDGYRRCPRSPCRVNVLPGTHHISAIALGHDRRSLEEAVPEARTVSLSLDAGSAAEARRQLGNALAQGVPPDRADFANTLSQAFGVRVVTVVYRDGNRIQTALFDHGLGRVVARSSVDTLSSAGTAVSAAISEWRGQIEPTPVLEEPWFWIGVGAAAVAAATVSIFLLTPPEPSNDLVFRAR